MSRRADLLLAGPRGRTICLDVTKLWLLSYLHGEPNLNADREDDDHDEDDEIVWVDGNAIRYEDDAIARVAAALHGIDPAGLRLGNRRLSEAVAETTASAVYWQEPAPEDLLLADPRVVAALGPIAEAIASNPRTEWWTAPLEPDDQWFARWIRRRKDTQADPPQLVGAAASRAAWRAAAITEERDAAARNAPHEESYSANWWSTPVFSGLVTTGPRLTDNCPSPLRFVEDSVGMRRARVARLQPVRGIRVYEIQEPDDLVELVSRFPLPMDHARRHDWFRAGNGCRGPWLLPDWAAIGERYDAVHLSVLGYLSTAGRALPVGDAYTMLAGWEPAKTWWLNDVLDQATDPITWKQRRSGRWRPLAT